MSCISDNKQTDRTIRKTQEKARTTPYRTCMTGCRQRAPEGTRKHGAQDRTWNGSVQMEDESWHAPQPQKGGEHQDDKSFGQLVVLGCVVTDYTPAPYRRRSLRRPSWGVLILRKASHLDAFSAYPYQTRIPGGAPGGTTGKPEVCPTRSSRTSVRSPQNSNAHDR